jgi:hypothetical protein
MTEGNAIVCVVEDDAALRAARFTWWSAGAFFCVR